MTTDPETPSALSDVPCESDVCRSRDLELTDTIAISSMKADVHGWVGHGVIHLSYCAHGRCRTCGRLFEAARTQIPVLLPELTCTTCERAEHLEYRVQELARTDGGYQFSVAIRCSHCRRLGAVTRLLRGLLSMISIEVGPAGITVKGAASAARS